MAYRSAGGSTLRRRLCRSRTQPAHNIDQVEPAAFALAVATLAVLLLLQSKTRWAPGPLAAVLLATIAVAVFDLEKHGVAVVGTVTGGLPSPPELPTLPELQQLVPQFRSVSRHDCRRSRRSGRWALVETTESHRHTSWLVTVR
jgi:MFS superfamily sulfate permease-like transporter